MKVAFAILFIFFMSFAVQSQARDLNFKEKTILLNLDKTISVKAYMENNIVVNELPLSQYLSYKVLKNSCMPLTKHIQKIDHSDEIKDQTKKLATLFNVCSQGVIGLTNLYIDQQ